MSDDAVDWGIMLPVIAAISGVGEAKKKTAHHTYTSTLASKHTHCAHAFTYTVGFTPDFLRGGLNLRARQLWWEPESAREDGLGRPEIWPSAATA